MDCGADAFGGAINGRDVKLLGTTRFHNVSALAGGVIQSAGEVFIPKERAGREIPTEKLAGVLVVFLGQLLVFSLKKRDVDSYEVKAKRKYIGAPFLSQTLVVGQNPAAWAALTVPKRRPLQ